MSSYECKCGSTDFFVEEQENRRGLYCNKCGKWKKWLGKDEYRLFKKEQSAETKEDIKEIHIDGCVTIPMNVTHDEFLEKFIKFIEDNGWYFGGGTKAFINGECIDE